MITILSSSDCMQTFLFIKKILELDMIKITPTVVGVAKRLKLCAESYRLANHQTNEYFSKDVSNLDELFEWLSRTKLGFVYVCLVLQKDDFYSFFDFYCYTTETVPTTAYRLEYFDTYHNSMKSIINIIIV